LEDIDFVLVMTVNPGFAGQKLIKQTLDKIGRLRHYLDQRGFSSIHVQVDGNVNFENAVKMRGAGADIFVAGSSGLFLKDMSIREAANKLKESIL
jgi:ribulose-phosphate 3-epimerase